MKTTRFLKLLLLVLLTYFFAGCLFPKNILSLKEQKRQKELAEQGRFIKKGVPNIKGAENKFGGAEREDEDKYDGIAAAQKREYDMTHDPATNTIPKERLLSALVKRKQSITLQQKLRVLSAEGNVPNGAISTIDAAAWVERGSYKDSPGPYGNPRDNSAVTSGRITALLSDLDPANPNQVFIGGIDGGLWSCPDITVSAPAWTFIDIFSNLAISSICQDPTNFNTLYFGTGEKTFNNDAVRGGGIWKSTDHGLTWSFLASTAAFYNVSKILCDNSGNLYVGTIGSGNGLQRSLDKGASWTDITPKIKSLTTSRVSDMVYDPINDRMGVYMGYYPSSLNRLVGYCYAQPSLVTQTTWNTPVSAAVGLGMFIANNTNSTQLLQTILTVKNGVVWALRSNDKFGSSPEALVLYRSVDGGATWTLQSTQTNSIYGAGQGWYSIGIDCDPLNPQANVIIGGLNVFKSVDNGKTFTQQSEWVTNANAGAPAQYVHADVHNIFYNTTGGQNTVIVCSDGGIFYSADGGNTWADRNVGLRIKQFYSCAINPSVPDYYLAGAQDNGSHQFTQPGLGASTEVNGGDGAIVAIDQLNPQNQITSYIYNNYHISTDGGNNWSSNQFGNNDGQFINPFDFDSKTKKMYAAYTAGNYLRWDDPTTTQNTASIVSVSLVIGSNTATAVTVSPNLANTIYVAGNNSLAKVVNANTSTPIVTNITPPLISPNGNISSIILGPGITDQDLMITISNYGLKKVFVSADGGTTWADITGNLPDMPVRWGLFYPGSNTQAYLATEAGVWYTTAINGSSTVWLPSPGFPAVRTDMIKYAATNGTIAVATHGRGLWTTKYSTVPKVSFYNAQLNTSKAWGTSPTNTCRTYYDYSDTIQISDAPSGAASVNISAQSGGTATLGADFDFTTNGSFTNPSTTALFASGVFPNKIPITVRVYNNHDKNAAQPQTANLIYTISGTTDAVVSTANQSLSINLTDIFPITTTKTGQTLWSENWENWPASFNSWTFLPEIYYGSPPNAVAFLPYKTSCLDNINNITAQLYSTDASGNNVSCTNIPGAYTALMSRAINAATNNYANIIVNFNYKSGATAEITNSLVYSIDNGTTWNTLATYPYITTTTNTSYNIPSSLNKINFLLGWQSVGTLAAVNSPYGFGVDDIVITGDILAPQIESTLSSTATNYETSLQNIDFYSANKNIIANVSNPSVDLGCITTTIENAGNTWQHYPSGTPSSLGTSSQKSFLITPATNGSNTNYNATIYFTTAELAGKDPNTLRIAKTSASSVSTSDGTNTIIVTTTSAAYNGYGFWFTGAFAGFSRFFLVDNFTVLPITLVSFTGYLINGNSELTWITASENNNHQFDVEVSTDGVNFVKLGTVLSQGNSSTNTTYSYTHVKPVAGFYFYRLKEVDDNGRFVYSNIINIKIDNGSAAKVILYPVPARKIITLNFGTLIQQATINLFSNDLKLLKTESVGQSTFSKDLDISQLPAGVYILRVITAGKIQNLRFVKE